MRIRCSRSSLRRGASGQIGSLRGDHGGLPVSLIEDLLVIGIQLDVILVCQVHYFLSEPRLARPAYVVESLRVRKLRMHAGLVGQPALCRQAMGGGEHVGRLVLVVVLAHLLLAPGVVKGLSVGRVGELMAHVELLMVQTLVLL